MIVFSGGGGDKLGMISRWQRLCVYGAFWCFGSGVHTQKVHSLAFAGHLVYIYIYIYIFSFW